MDAIPKDLDRDLPLADSGLMCSCAPFHRRKPTSAVTVMEKPSSERGDNMLALSEYGVGVLNPGLLWPIHVVWA